MDGQRNYFDNKIIKQDNCELKTTIPRLVISGTMEQTISDS